MCGELGRIKKPRRSTVHTDNGVENNDWLSRCALRRKNVYDFFGFAVPLKLHDAVGKSENGIVAGATRVHARCESRATLAHDNASCGDLFAAEALDTQSLGIAIATVPGTAAAFFMSHATLLLLILWW